MAAGASDLPIVSSGLIGREAALEVLGQALAGEATGAWASV